MTPNQVLQMPIDQFWLIEKNIARIEATQTIRRLDVAVASQSSEGYKNYHAGLVREIGSVVVETPKLDKRGLDALKGMKQGF